MPAALSTVGDTPVQVRALVSGNRVRYQDGIFDLDLAYITQDCIAMSFPAEVILTP
jgi:phosphatidylinositol-3,4,5-trisphosphate 3-phosphatase/dual-specificity protein phosphatase PTEN